MKHIVICAFVVLVFQLGLTSCATAQSSTGIAGEVSAESYAQGKGTKGVVVMAVNWGRKWACGAFENAELRRIAFDRIPIRDGAGEEEFDLLLDGPPRLMTQPVFIDYAFLLELGEYALSGVSIKVAKSVRDVGYFNGRRAQLIKNGEPLGGAFDTKAGEIVYIGHFFLDCHADPILWRYYSDGREAFKAHMAQVKQKYPFLDTDKAQFRLFRTKTLGNDYQLP